MTELEHRFRDAHKDKVVFSTYLNMVIEPKTRYSQLIAPSAKVTGGGTGLGLAAAKAFARSGARVFLAARRQAPLETAKAEVESIGGEADYAIVDVIDPESVKTGVEAAVKRFGKIDIVVANAGRDADALGRSEHLLAPFSSLASCCSYLCDFHDTRDRRVRR